MEYPLYYKNKIDYTLTKIFCLDFKEETGRLLYFARKDEECINKNFFSKGYWINEEDKTAKKWDAESGAAIANLTGHEYAFTSAVFLHD
jgi:hypothetical protein